VYVENQELARQLVAYMNEGVLPRNAYRVMLDENQDIVWHTQMDGQPVTFTKEPDSTVWQRFMSGFIQMLPVEKQL